MNILADDANGQPDFIESQFGASGRDCLGTVILYLAVQD